MPYLLKHPPKDAKVLSVWLIDDNVGRLDLETQSDMIDTASGGMRTNKTEPEDLSEPPSSDDGYDPY